MNFVRIIQYQALLITVLSLLTGKVFAVAKRPSLKYLPPNGFGNSGETIIHLHLPGIISRDRYLPSSGGRQHHHSITIPPITVTPHYGHKPTPAPPPPIAILRQNFINHGNGNYNFGFETANGIKRDESATFQKIGNEGIINIRGSYSYTGDDGKLYSVTYTADNTGFHAVGAHIPTPPSGQQKTKSLFQHVHRAVVKPSTYGQSSKQGLAANYLPPLSNTNSQGYKYGKHQH